MAIVLALLALALAAVALVIALKKQTVKVTKETTTVIEHAPADHPFYYDERANAYVLNGSLEANGSISCMNNKEE